MDRDVQEGSSFELPYAEAAGRLRERGELSPVIGTSFGYHVILLLERVPALSLPADERRRVLRDDVRLGRARAAQRQLVGELRGRSRVDVVPNVDALLALPRVEP
jgi:parvulin-like peptidyl-prolyl isomerase